MLCARCNWKLKSVSCRSVKLRHRVCREGRTCALQGTDWLWLTGGMETHYNMLSISCQDPKYVFLFSHIEVYLTSLQKYLVDMYVITIMIILIVCAVVKTSSSNHLTKVTGWPLLGPKAFTD